jgi:hypothetical protein
MKRLVQLILAASLLSLSCQTIYNLVNPNEPTTLTPIPASDDDVPSNKVASIAEKLDELGGQPCQDIDDFTCVTITVPLDHFDPANTETIDIVLAVAPALGERDVRPSLPWRTGR